MLKLNLDVHFGCTGFDKNGKERLSMTAGQIPRLVQWDFRSRINPITVYVKYQNGIDDKTPTRKILWMTESTFFDAGNAKFVRDNLQKAVSTFEQIWTHNLSLIGLHQSIKLVVPAMGTWILREEAGIHKKTKLVSMVVSGKDLTEQQKFRKKWAKDHAHEVDVYGRDTRPIDSKAEALKDYMFSVAIESDTYDTYFTEKLLDCFMCGTIPVYKGTRKVTEYFNADGIIFLDDLQSVSSLTCDLYQKKIDAIKDNFVRVQNFITADDAAVNHLISS
jgi:hypothetical protein